MTSAATGRCGQQSVSGYRLAQLPCRPHTCFLLATPQRASPLYHRRIAVVQRRFQAARCQERVPQSASTPAELAEGAHRVHSRPWWRRPPQLRSKYDKEIVHLAIPALGALLLDPIMSLVDSALVGRLGTTHLAGVGCGSMSLLFFTFPFYFLLLITTPAVARAVANSDKAEASKVTTRGMQLATAMAVIAAGLGFRFSGNGVRFFTKNPHVAGHALTYIRCRLLGLPALLWIHVMAGTFRGHKDTKTPLTAAVVSNVAHLALDILFLFVFGWGVAGAALSTAASQYISAVVLFSLLVKKDMVRPRDLLQPITWDKWAPMLKAGLELSGRSMLSISLPMLATSRVGTYGTVALATNELMRQLYLLSIQMLGALDVSAQALVAASLGRGDRREARAVAMRILQVGMTCAACLSAVLMCLRFRVPRLFTSDPAVIKMAGQYLPIVALALPFDSAASVIDGSLLGASETSYISKAMIFSSAFTLVLFFQLTSRYQNLAVVWLSIKVLTLLRIVTGAVRIASPHSSFQEYPSEFTNPDGHEHSSSSVGLGAA